METGTNMEATPVPDYERGLTFEKVWASIQKLKEEQRESDRIFKEQLKESDRKLTERMERSANRLDRQISSLGNRFGEMIECLASPGLKEKFRSLGFDFTESARDKDFADGSRIIAEVDVFLESNKEAMAVEIKSKPDLDDIKEHAERMDRLRSYADAKGDKRKYYGAIGGMVFGENARNYAFKHGFYVIEPSGSTFDVTAPKGEFSPRAW